MNHIHFTVSEYLTVLRHTTIEYNLIRLKEVLQDHIIGWELTVEIYNVIFSL